MKLIVQVPCFNEEATLPLVINSIPKRIPGISQVETLVIDDGSTDRTVEVAKQLGVDHVLRHKQNRGLAISFSDGLQRALELGADIIVNTDGDNQYPQQDIPRLIKPILSGKYDMVVADRQTGTIPHFSPTKKLLQKVGSGVVRKLSGTDIPDAPSGFRAYSRDSAMSLNVITTFSYVTETIIQAGKKRLAITHVPIITNPKTRESRLFKNIFQHVQKTTVSMIRSYTMYEPFKVFLLSGLSVFFIGTLPFFNFLFLMFTRGEVIGGHIQSLIFGAVFLIFGVMLTIMGLLADLMAVNRKLTEDALYRLKKLEYERPIVVATDKSFKKIKNNQINRKSDLPNYIYGNV